ncbi:hypothetical protein [Cohnella cellulosilytica]|uniref:Bulb-type lectin domain-containing protein n=1 Tax=Cohnella cellulosilytica TaxID=986710 RepID=A0ABW2F9K4_9BACL
MSSRRVDNVEMTAGAALGIAPATEDRVTAVDGALRLAANGTGRITAFGAASHSDGDRSPSRPGPVAGGWAVWRTGLKMCRGAWLQGSLLAIMGTCLLLAAAPSTEAAVLPRSAEEPSRTIHYIDMENSAYELTDLMMIQSLQGLVNREEPRIWVLKNPIHLYDVQPGFSANSVMVERDFWFDRLTGYTKLPYTDPYALVAAFADELAGAVIYDEDVLDPTGAGNSGTFNYYTGGSSVNAEPNKSFLPSDTRVANLNVTAMLSARHGAVALTEEQLLKLENDYDVTLPVLADSGALGLDSWEEAYDYALTELAPYMRDDILAANPNYSLAMFDYIIANNIFTFHLKGDPQANSGLTTSEKAKLDALVEQAPGVAPIIGTWGGSTDEDAFGRYLNVKGKYALVTSESFNMSWTSGLPMVRPAASETTRSLVYDPTKVYISFTETDGDTLLFPHLKFPTWFALADREDYPIAWELTPLLAEIDPLATAYYNEQRGSNSYVTPVTGVGYIKYPMPDQYKDDYFELTDDYMAYMRQRTLRTMNYDRFDAAAYTPIPSVEGVFAGYGGLDPERPAVANNRETHFRYMGKPIFINYSFFDRTAISNYSGTEPAFFNVGAQYINTELLTDYIDNLPARFVVVTPGEMVDLYRQYAESVFEEITEAGFLASFTHDESGFLHTDDGSYISDGDHRVADGAHSWVYRFNLDDAETMLELEIDIANNYVVEASVNESVWNVVAQAASDIHDATNRQTLTLDLSSYLTSNSSNTVYVRFRDGSPTDGWGPSLYSVSVNGGIIEGVTSHDTLTSGKMLQDGEFLASPSGTYCLTMQTDGNLVLYSGSNPASNTGVVWQSGVTGTIGNYFAMMQTDGNLVVYQGTGPSNNLGYVWSSGTNGPTSAHLILKDDGKIYIYEGDAPASAGNLLWSRP